MSARLQSWTLSVVAASAIVLLSACGGGGGGGKSTGSALPATGGGNSGTSTTQSTAPATFSLSLQQYAPVNTSATHRRAAYISPATAEISLTVASVNGTPTSGAAITFPVGPTAANCSSSGGIVSCSLAANIPIGNDTLTAQTLDATGKSLGSSTIAATVVQNATNRIALAVGGQIANLQLYLSQSQFTSGTAGSANVIVVQLDASGAEIVNPGDYNPPITVTSSNSVSGHLSLITDGSNTGQTATIASPNDQVVVSYDGVAASGNSNITASAGSGITSTKNISVYSPGIPGLSASPSGAQYTHSSSAYVFTAAGQTGTIAVSGGTGPYTVTSGDTTLATISGSGPYTVTAVGYGVNGSTTITVTDSLNATTTIPVTFIAPAVAVAVTSCASDATCAATSATYTIPANGSAPTLLPTTITAGGGTGTYSYAFATTGTTASPYMTVTQTGAVFTITPNGGGNDALIIISGNQTGYYGVVAGAGGASYAIGTISNGYPNGANGVTLAYSSTQVIAGSATIALTAANAPWTITNNCSGTASVVTSNNNVVVTAANSSGTCTVNFVPAVGSAPTALTVNAVPVLSASSVAVTENAIGQVFGVTLSNQTPSGLSVAAGSITVSPATGVVSLAYNSGTGVLSITATGAGTARISIHDTVSDERIGIAVTVGTTFAASLPSAIGMQTGVAYSATLPATVSSGSVTSGTTPNGFSVTPGSPGSIVASPLSGSQEHGTITFVQTGGGTAAVPFTVFSIAPQTYPGSAIGASAVEAFTATGQTDTVDVGGASGAITATSGNTNIVTTSVAGSVITVNAVGVGITSITVTDATGASISYSVSVTTTTIPIAGRTRLP